MARARARTDAQSNPGEKKNPDGYQWNNVRSHAGSDVSGQLLFVLID